MKKSLRRHLAVSELLDQSAGKCCLCRAYKSKSLVAIAAENAKIKIAKLSSLEQLNTHFKLSTLVPGFLVPSLPQYPASQQSREPAEHAHRKILGPSTNVSTTISVPPVKSHVSAEIEKGEIRQKRRVITGLLRTTC